MAAVGSLPSSILCYRTCRETLTPSPSPSSSSLSFRPTRIAPLSRSSKRRETATIKAVDEDEILALEAEPEEESSPPADQTVPISPFDMLTMFFKAEGTMDDSAATKISKSLEDVEGISDLKVRTAEGIATVELTKETTVQATGVASNLVEVIQGSGFKLQTLNLSFEDEEDAAKS